MLPEENWKADAIMRLLLSVIVCFFAGSFLLSAVQYTGPSGARHLQVYALAAGSLLCLVGALWLLHRPWRLEDSLRRLIYLLALFYGGLVLGAGSAKLADPIKPSVVQMIVSALSLQGAFLVLLGPFLRKHETTWPVAFGLRRNWLTALLLGMVFACAFLPLAWVLQGFSGEVMSRLNFKPEQQQVVQTLEIDQALPARVIFGLITILIVPVAEESFFRGILYVWIKRAGYPRLALFGTAVLFAAVHANAASFLPLLVLALALTLLYERTGNLLAPIAAHALFNAANLIKLYLIQSAMSR
jgi:membrane protease YdiL (CAAX protease family)